MGWHADDEKLFGAMQHDCTIVSLSLGATREYNPANLIASSAIGREQYQHRITYI